MINRTKIPSVKTIDTIKIQSPSKGKLDNGINYYGFYSKNSPVIKLDLIFKAGVVYQNKALQSVVSNSLIKEAPKGENPDEIADFFEYYGSFVETFSGPEVSGLRLFVPKKYFSDVIGTFANLVKNPDLPSKEFEILKKKYYSSIQNNMKKTKYVAMRGMNLEIFGSDNQLGYFVKPEDAENIYLEDIIKFTENYYNHKNCTILISGEYDDAIIGSLNLELGDVKGSKSWKNDCKLTESITLTGEMNKIKLYEFENAVQSSIYGGTILDLKSDDDYILMGIVNTILGGYFGSRLMKNIREDKGYTYGIGSFVSEFFDKAVLRIVSDVGVDVTKQAIDEVYVELQNLIDSPVEEKELSLIKNYMKGELISAFDGVFATSLSFEKLITKNRSEKFIHKTIELINNVNSLDLQSFIKNKINPEDFSFVIAGKY